MPAKKDKDNENRQDEEKGEQKDENQKEKNQDNQSQSGDKKNEDNQKSEDKDKSDKGDGRSKQKEYFKEELKRLESSLQRESTKIKVPPKKEHTPYIFNNLEPYYSTATPRYLIELPDEIRHGYVSRQTAIGLCDPWKAHEMDVELLPKIESKAVPQQEEEKKKKSSPRNKEGSTRLPKFPAVTMSMDDLSKKPLNYGDVPMLREELRKKYSSNSGEKMDEDYKRTKQDFYRMELDKMEEYHKSNRPKMRATYFAYLQNNAGSRKAVHECVKEMDKKEKDEDEKNDKNKKSENSKKSTGGGIHGSRKSTGHGSRQAQPVA